MGGAIHPHVPRTSFHQTPYYVFLELVKELRDYREKHELDDDEESLMGYVLRGLQEIIQPGRTTGSAVS